MSPLVSWAVVIIAAILLFIWALKYLIWIAIGIGLGLFLAHAISDAWKRVSAGAG